MYITYTDAQTYLEERLPIPSGWNSNTEDTRIRALKTASRYLDNLKYIGEKVDDAQEHEFPRTGQTAIPETLQQACVEIAEMLLQGSDVESDYDDLSVVSQGISSARITYDRDMIPENQVMGIPSIVAWRLIRPWLQDNRDVAIRRVS